MVGFYKQDNEPSGSKFRESDQLSNYWHFRKDPAPQTQLVI